MKKIILLALMLVSETAFASVVPEYAANDYSKHELNRSEQKCIDEGYKITYANCDNQTAPSDPCPYNDTYYRTCSQEQWCRNNNYTFKEEDCELPSYPTKMCDNKLSMYRACQEDAAKACEEAGFTSKEKCQLTDKRCPYNSNYGKCCDTCPQFEYVLSEVPAGYIAQGETCTTCEGVVKTNVVEAPCDGYMSCQYGPLSAQTSSCLKGKNMLYSACKTSEMVCKEQGFLYSSCPETEDTLTCPENDNFKKCSVNCHKLAISMYPEADIIGEDITDPVVDVTKKSMKSLYGEISEVCKSNVRPEVTLNLNEKNLEMYANIFERDISDVNFILNYETPVSLSITGALNNVRITLKGEAPDCPLKGQSFNVTGTVSFVDVSNICANINIDDNSKFISTGNVTGDVNVGKDSSLAIKGNLIGSLKTKSFAQIYIKGILKYTDTQNTTADSESIVFGCNTQAKIAGGIVADTSNIIVKQRSVLDVPYIKLISTSNNPDLPNTLSSIHLHRYSRTLSVLDNIEYPLIENNKMDCDDKYLLHLGSSLDEKSQTTTLEPSNLMEDKWQCRELDKQQLKCN